MVRVLLALYTALGLLTVIGMSAYTLTEVYRAFRESAAGFWSALFAFRGGFLWASWTLVPFGVLATLYLRSPRVWKSKSYDLQYAAFATGSLLAGAIGFLLLSFDLLPFDKSEPKLYFSVLPLPQLAICGITYELWRYYGGTLKSHRLTAHSTGTRAPRRRRR